MAAPNLKNPTSIVGITTTVILSGTGIVGVLTNISNSNKVFKINSIFAANTNSTNSADISVSIFRNSTDFYLARTLSISPAATQIVSSKETYFYLEETVGIRAQASVGNYFHITISYEEIS